MKDFPETLRKAVIPEVNRPVPILDEKGEVAALIVHPDQYASMVDQIQDGKIYAMAVEKLTGTTDPAKLSLENFLEICGITDEQLANACK